MSLTHLLLKEILHRKLNTGLSLLSVAVAAGFLVGSVVLLNAFDLRTEALIAEKEAEMRTHMAEVEDSMRKAMKKMGFNVLILPADQSLGDFYAENYAEKTMPEAYAETLANAKEVVTIRHLLPMLQRKLEWPEAKRKVLLIGVRGEMAWTHRDNMKPVLKPVPEGTLALGYELARGMEIRDGDETRQAKVGDTVTFLGREFTVGALHPERGTIDDITVWIDLDEMQAMLDMEGRINCMMALECKCAWADLPKIRKEIQSIVPDTQVIEVAGKALARAEARTVVEEGHKKAIATKKEERAALKRKREELIGVLVPLVVAACAVWVGLLAFNNVRERRIEIGILRTLGLRTSHILFVFLAKSAMFGLAGAVAGIVVGVAGALCVTELPGQATANAALPPLAFLAGAVLLAPVVTILASWVPSLMAAQQDPAVVLRQE